MAGWALNRPLLLLLTRNARVCPDSLGGPALRAVAQPGTVCAPASSSADWSAPAADAGASLTAVMVMVKVCAALVSAPPLAVPPSSRRARVMVALPLALAAGV